MTAKKSENKNRKVTGSEKNNSNYLFYVPCLLIIILVFSIYNHTIDYNFHFDDETSIIRNSTIKSFEEFSEISYWISLRERPVTYFTFALNYAFSKLDTSSYRFVNLIIHIVNSILIYLLINLLIRIKYPEIKEKNRLLISAGSALIFAAHPIQIMAVTYLAQRGTSLTTMFFLISIISFIKGRVMYFNKKGKADYVVYYIVCLITTILALLSKQNAVTLPLVLWITEFFFIRNRQNQKARKFLTISAALFLLVIVVVLTLGLLPRENLDIPRWHYLITQFRVYLIYFKLMILPYGFNPDHGLILSETLTGVYELSGLVILMVMLALAVYTLKKAPLVSFGIFWYFITMSVESGIIPITDLVMEHRNYLPFFGIVLIFSFLVFKLLKQRVTSYVLVMTIIILFLGVRSYNRNLDWENNTTLWLSSLEENPDNKRALVYIGRAYVQTDPDKALNYFNRAIEVDSAYYHGWLNRGLILFDMGRYREVINSINRAHECSEAHHHYSYFIRGVSNISVKDYQNAVLDFNKYINRAGGNAETHTYRGQAHYYLKNYLLAAKDFQKAYSYDPSKTGLIMNIVECYYRADKPVQVEKYINMAMEKGLKVNQAYLSYLKNRKTF